MIRFESKPELSEKLVVGTSVKLSWNLKMKANITLYQRYETEDGAYSKFLDQICSNAKKSFKWVVPQYLSNKSDLFLCLHPTKGNLNTTSQCFAVINKYEEEEEEKTSKINNNSGNNNNTSGVGVGKGNKQDQGISTKVLSFIDNLVTKNPQRRLPRGKLIGRRAPSWIVSGGKNAFHRKKTNSSFQSLLPLLKDGKPVAGCYYHTIGKTGYFECKILDCEPFSSEIGIGLAGENFPIVNNMVGDTDDSYGYSSNTGSVLTNNDHPTRKSAQTFGSGDTVGCGIHIESGDVFFTLNGILVSVAFPGTLRYSKRETVYPTISGSGRAEIQFIFGNEKFKFQQFAEVARLCERQHRRRRSWGIDDLPAGTTMNDVEAKKDQKRKSKIFEGSKGRRHSTHDVLGRHSRSSQRGSGKKNNNLLPLVSITTISNDEVESSTGDDDEDEDDTSMNMDKAKKRSKKKLLPPGAPPPIPVAKQTLRKKAGFKSFQSKKKGKNKRRAIASGGNNIPVHIRLKSKAVADEGGDKFYPTVANQTRWVLKKKGRRTGAMVTRYFHIDSDGYFVYFSSEDSMSPVGRINFLGSKIKIKSISMLEIHVKSRTEPIYVDGFGNLTAVKAKAILMQLQKDIEDVDIPGKDVTVYGLKSEDDDGSDNEENNILPEKEVEALKKLKNFEVAMTKKISRKKPDSQQNEQVDVSESEGSLKLKNNDTQEEEKMVVTNNIATSSSKIVLSTPGSTNASLKLPSASEKGNSLTTLYDIPISTWKVQEVIKWLHELKLGQYTTSFEEMGMDGDSLLDMNDEDLKGDLNVPKRLHRVKLLKTVKKLIKNQAEKGILVATEDGYTARSKNSDDVSHNKDSIQNFNQSVTNRDSTRSSNSNMSSVDFREMSMSSDDGRTYSSPSDLKSLHIDVEDDYHNYPTIAAIFANPLVMVRNNKLMPMPLLDWETERKVLCGSLSEAGALAKLTFSHATADVLRTVITKGCRVLHYSGHGNSNFLSFEDGAGCFHALENERLKSLFAAGAGDLAAGNPKPKLVFVSACSSRKAGEAFLEAGAKHVVCVETLSEIEDRAAHAFTRAFYTALARGYYVQSAFQIGQSAVEGNPLVGRGVSSNAVKEAKKFLLLPALDSDEDERHHVSLFPDMCRNKETEWIRPAPLHIENLPAPPDGFVGRQLDMFNIVSTLIKKSRRIVSVIGEKGIGKSAIVKKAIHYLADRGSFADGILHIHIAKNSSIEMIADELVSEHEERSFRKKHPQPLTPSERHLFVNDNDNDDAKQSTDKARSGKRMKRRTTQFGNFNDKNNFESIASHICRILRSSECLIVFDDLEENCEIWPLMSKILRQCHKVRFLLTCVSPLSSLLKDETGVHDYPEHVLRVTKMTIHETARMIRSRASRTTVRVDDLVNNYSAELATVSTPIKILKVVSKLDIMEVCKEAFEV